MGRYDQTEAKKSTILMTGIVITVLALAGWLYFDQAHQDATGPETTQLSLPLASSDLSPDASAPDAMTNHQDAVEHIDSTGQAQPIQPSILPELSKSDQSFRDAMLGVSAELAPWLQTDHLIRKYMLIANDFSQGIRLEKHMRFLKQSQPFSVEKTADRIFIAQESYRRYDKFAAAIDAIDSTTAVAVYRKFSPLLLQVFNEFAYPPERPMEDIFLKSAAQIFAAPIVEQPIALVRPSVFYKFADEKLEGLSPIAKQMLRMGPKNTRIIQNKFRELVQALVNSEE